STPQNGRVECPRPCRPHPCRPRRVSRRRDNAKWFGRSVWEVSPSLAEHVRSADMVSQPKVELPALTIAAWRGKLPHSPMNCSLLDKPGIWRDVQAGE